MQEVAERLGVSERTVRRRIQAGQLQAASVDTPQGHTWRIDPASLPAAAATPPGTPDNHPADATRQDPAPSGHTLDATRHPAATPPGTPDMLELVRLVDRLQHENVQLAGQLGFTQAKLQEAEKQIALLMAPNEPETRVEPAAVPEPQRSLWKRLFRK